MKRVIYFTLLIVVLSMVTACSESHSLLTIRRGGKVSYEYSFGLMQVVIEAVRSNGEDPFGAIKKRLVENGFQVSDYQKEGYQGFTAHGDFPSVEALMESLEANKEWLGATLNVKTKKGLFKSVITLSVKTDFSAVGDELMTNDQAEGFLPENFTKNLDYTYAIRTPFKVISHNASQVDEKGGLYTWQLDPFSVNTLVLTYEKMHTGGWILLASLCVAVGTLIIFFLRKKNIIAFGKESRFTKK